MVFLKKCGKWVHMKIYSFPQCKKSFSVRLILIIDLKDLTTYL